MHVIPSEPNGELPLKALDEAIRYPGVPCCRLPTSKLLPGNCRVAHVQTCRRTCPAQEPPG